MWHLNLDVVTLQNGDKSSRHDNEDDDGEDETSDSNEEDEEEDDDYDDDDEAEKLPTDRVDGSVEVRGNGAISEGGDSEVASPAPQPQKVFENSAIF